MNLKAIRAFLLLEWKQVLLILIPPAILILAGGRLISENAMFSLPSFFMALPLGQWLYMSCWFAFPEGLRWPRQWMPQNNPMEFFLSQPLSRRSLFYTKATLFLASYIIPLACFCLYAISKPAVRLELPYPPAIREVTRNFYLTRVAGAYLEQDASDKTGRKLWVVLPRGQVTWGLMALALGTATVLAAQCLLFIFWRVSGGFLTIVALSVFLSLLSYRLPEGLPPTEWIFAFMSQHAAAVFIALGVCIPLIQYLCCRRYVAAEITD